MPESEVRHVAWQLYSSIDYLHQRKVAHRDIKLENILIESLNSSGNKLEIKLTDFGCADFFSEEDGLMGGQVGSNNCMAPEMLQNQRYDCKVDIWSLSVVIYILLSGEMPFYGKDLKELHKAILECEPDFSSHKWKQVCPNAINFVKQGLQKDPALRPSSEEMLEHDWFSEVLCPYAVACGLYPTPHQQKSIPRSKQT